MTWWGVGGVDVGGVIVNHGRYFPGIVLVEAAWMGMSAEDDLVIRGHPFRMTFHDLAGVKTED